MEIVSCTPHGNAYKIQTKCGRPFYAPKSTFISLKMIPISPQDNLFNEKIRILELDPCPLLPGMSIDYVSPSEFSISGSPMVQKLIAHLKPTHNLTAACTILYKTLADKYAIRQRVYADVPQKYASEIFKSIYEFNRMIAVIETYQEFRANPYMCLEHNRNIFHIVDKFAEIYNINDQIRMERCIEHRLKGMETDDGHMCVPLNVLVNEMKQDVRTIIQNSKLFQIHNNYVYTTIKYAHEKGVAELVRKLIDKTIDDKPMLKDDTIQHYISEFEADTKMQLNAKQKMAVQLLFSTCNILILTGFPGTGKSSVVACIRHVCDRVKKSYAIMAPTGKAANRLGKTASTIHRALDVKIDTLGNFNFQKNQTNALDFDIVIVDESSMLDGKLAYHLFNAVNANRTRVLIIGDPDQLPSVDAGDVLNKLIAAKVVPCVSLTKIYRQDADAIDICTFARMVVKGKLIKKSDLTKMPTIRWFLDMDANSEVYEKLGDLYREFNGNIQILIPSKKNDRGTIVVNRYIHKLLYGNNNDGGFCENEKIICVKNCYGESSVFNGESGLYKKAQEGCNHAVVFDDKMVTMKTDEIDYGYAITVHKSQGSEYANVVIVLDFSHGYTLNRKLLYTAIMRAKNSLTIIGNIDAIQKCVRVIGATRWSLLDEFIKEGYEIES